MKRENQKKRALYYGGDNLAVMRGLENNIADLIYLDPPFNSKSIHKGAMGSKAEKQQFKDIWRMGDINNEELEDLKLYAPDMHSLISILGGINGESWQAYLTFMAVRLMEMHRLLKDTGSVYLHCDSTMSHGLKLLLDIIFGRENFRNEIIWCYTGPSKTIKHFHRKHDIILRYTKSENWIFNHDKVRVPYKMIGIGKGDAIFQGGDNRERVEELLKKGKIPTDWWADDHLTNISAWKKERTGWATQKPLALLKRIILASSNPGDLVLDPFCGCATACVAAEEEGRAWIGIDKDKESLKIMKMRTKGQQKFDKIWDYVELINASKTKMLPVREEIRAIKIPRNKWHQTKAVLYKKQDGKCAAAPLCTHEIPIELMEVDRIKAGAHGGQYVIGNVQLLCPRCNRMKGKGTMEALKEKLSQKRFDY